MVSFGSIARLNPEKTINYLMNLKKNNLEIYQGKYNQISETYYWFYSLCGYFLADSYDGETPLISTVRA